MKGTFIVSSRLKKNEALEKGLVQGHTISKWQCWSQIWSFDSCSRFSVVLCSVPLTTQEGGGIWFEFLGSPKVFQGVVSEGTFSYAKNFLSTLHHLEPVSSCW